MNNLNGVFRIIKEQCKEVEIPNETCFPSLVKMVEDNDIFLPIYTYTAILEDFGLIKFSAQTKEIILTKKGRDSNSVFDFLLG